MQFSLSSMARRAAPQPIGYLMSKGVSGDCISLAAGLVDGGTLPAPEVCRLLEGLLPKRGRIALQYGSNEGLVSLREKVLSRVLRQDSLQPESVSVDRLLLSTGSQQMLYILTELMVDPGDVVIVPVPTYFVYLGVLQAAGARVIGIPVDSDGLRVDLFADALRQIESAGASNLLKIIYLTTYFQNPSGISLSAARRRELISTLNSFDSFSPLVIEDAAYRELRFSGDDIPSLWSHDPSGRIAYLGTFSKPFSPGLRTGFSILPSALVEKVTLIKGHHDFGSASFTQHVIDLFLESGLYDSHIEKLRATYRRKCDLLCDALDRHMLDSLTHLSPGGGLYVWAEIPGVDTRMDSPFFSRCLENGVIYVPGDFCYPEPDKTPTGKMRLSYGPTPAEDIDEGVRRLAVSLAETPTRG